MGDTTGIRDWFARWGVCIASQDFERAKPLFLEKVIGFGTFKDLVHGIDALEQGQWRNIWPTISNFAFNLDSIETLFSPDGRQAVAIVMWDSTGIDAQGNNYDRPGRATVVLRRDEGIWHGVHTHFSLCPAEKKASFGNSSS
jgi:ketosteroid isomerase-like protein